MTRVPAWLNEARNPAHLTQVIRILTDREIIRRGAQRPSSTFNEVYSVSTSIHPSNLRDNRYGDIFAYDRTRVVVGSGARYINANWVRERMGAKWWIASQAPLPHTAHAFLSLMLEPISNPLDSACAQSRMRTVVQLTLFTENGRRKADRYFPTTPGQDAVVQPTPGTNLPALIVTLVSQTSIPDAHCTESVVSVRPVSPADAKPVTFTHLFYSAWPDHGIPKRAEYEKLLAFMRFVDKTNKEPPQDADVSTDLDPPIIVGCSAGIGRSGSFIALVSLLRGHGLLFDSSAPSSPPPDLAVSPLGPLPDELKNDLVALEVDSLREQRPGMVERREQLLLIYDVLIAAFENVR